MLEGVRVFDEMDRVTYGQLWTNLIGITEEECDWRPHPQANSVR